MAGEMAKTIIMGPSDETFLFLFSEPDPKAAWHDTSKFQSTPSTSAERGNGAKILMKTFVVVAAAADTGWFFWPFCKRNKRCS